MMCFPIHGQDLASMSLDFIYLICCLTPYSTIFQSYDGVQFLLVDTRVETINLPQVNWQTFSHKSKRPQLDSNSEGSGLVI